MELKTQSYYQVFAGYSVLFSCTANKQFLIVTDFSGLGKNLRLSEEWWKKSLLPCAALGNPNLKKKAKDFSFWLASGLIRKFQFFL